jgi:hypothetical protein
MSVKRIILVLVLGTLYVAYLDLPHFIRKEYNLDFNIILEIIFYMLPFIIYGLAKIVIKKQ